MTFFPDVVVYHNPCSDGGASAALLADYYGDHPITWIAGNYGNRNLIDDVIAAAAGKKLLLVDFSFKADVMEHLLTKVPTVVVLDHHDSALREFKKLPGSVIRDPHTDEGFTVHGGYAPGLHAFMTMDMSGAGLTYAWLYGMEEGLPEAVGLTQDIDLGREPTERHRDYKWYTRSFDPGVEALRARNFGALLREPRVSQSILDEGAAVRRFADLCVAQYTEQARIIQLQSDADGVTSDPLPVGFASYAFASAVANALIYKRDGGRYNMAVCVYFDANGMGLSLRSKNGVECNRVAASLGGGGHKQAAGVNIAWADVVDFVTATVHDIRTEDASDDS